MLMLAGGAIAVTGTVAAIHTANTQMLCQLFIDDGIPPPGSHTVSCTAIDTRLAAEIIVAVVGVIAVVLAAAVLVVRGRRAAAAAGRPWLVRRCSHAAARWLDANLPGRRSPKPRIRPAFLTALAWTVTGVVALTLLSSAASALQRRATDAEMSAYDMAQKAAGALSLPAVIQREPTSTCGAAICGHSRLSPSQLAPYLRGLVHGRILGDIGQGGSEWISGDVRDYPVNAIAAWHMIFLWPGQHAPPGSIAAPHGRGRLYLDGSDVYINAPDPPDAPSD